MVLSHETMPTKVNGLSMSARKALGPLINTIIVITTVMIAVAASLYRLFIFLFHGQSQSQSTQTKPFRENLIGKSMCWFSFFQVFLISLLGKALYTDAWGKEGHFMVCRIAESYLTDAASAAVLDLLPPGAAGELASVCSWADDVRLFKYKWSSPLHFIDTPGVCNYNYSRDCHNPAGEMNMCVAGAINNYTQQLQLYGKSSSAYNLTESLMFLAHFMGDIHQPLHVSFADDLGGNTIVVRWYTVKTNLHSVWDTRIIDTAMADFYNKDMNTMIEAIERNITDGWSDEVAEWEACSDKSLTCADKYASESIVLSCNYAYKDVVQNMTLGDDYFYSRYPVVVKRIAQAGMRLAALLNQILDSGTGDINPELLEA